MVIKENMNAVRSVLIACSRPFITGPAILVAAKRATELETNIFLLSPKKVQKRPKQSKQTCMVAYM